MIEPLPIEFKAHGRAYRQLARKGIVALYELRNLNANEPHRLIGFELVIVRYQKPWPRDTWSFPERERYPLNREFGSYAWSLPAQSRETAELAFDQLANSHFGNVKRYASAADYVGWGKGGSQIFRTLLPQLLTGRRLPKRSTMKNTVTAATERLTES